jgi:hypothetical protein
MSSFISRHGRGVSAKKALPLFFLCLAAVFFTGCDTGGTPGNLEGVWSSGFDGYEIYGNTLIYNGYDSRPNGRFSFIAAIENSPNFSASSGVLIVKYLMPPFYDPNYSYTGSTAFTLPSNSYMGIYWRELNSNSVLLANAWDPAGPETEAATYAAAAAKFTPYAENNFVGWAGVTAQVRQYPNRGALRGTWDDTTTMGGGYLVRAIITNTTYTVYLDGDGDSEIDLEGGSDTIQYSGFIEETDSVSTQSGNMYVKLNNTDGLSSDIGDYLVVHWENRTASSVELADVVTPVASLDSAKTINSGAAVDDAYVTSQSVDYYSYSLASRP